MIMPSKSGKHLLTEKLQRYSFLIEVLVMQPVTSLWFDSIKNSLKQNRYIQNLVQDCFDKCVFTYIIEMRLVPVLQPNLNFSKFSTALISLLRFLLIQSFFRIPKTFALIMKV